MKKPKKAVRKIPVPFINTGLDDSKVIIKYPKDPLQIGSVIVNGNPQPVWLDPADLVMTPALKEEQAANMKGQAVANSEHNAKMEIAALVEAWMERCLKQLVPATINFHDQSAVAAWLSHSNIDYIEDNSNPGVVRFFMRKAGQVVSEFTAKLSKPQIQVPINN